MQSTIETQINKLGGGKQEELKALDEIDLAAYISDVNAYALGTEQPYSDEHGQLFTKMLEDICRGLKDERNMDSLKKHARTILNKLSTNRTHQFYPVKFLIRFISGNYPPTPETIMFKYQVLLHNNELDIDQGVDHFVHECRMMHDFYLSMEASSLEAGSKLLEQSAADLANLKSGKTLTGAISNTLKQVTDLADKNGPVLYLTILATALIERGVATPSKMAKLAVILAPFLSSNSSTSTTASANASPPNLKNLLNDDKALGEIENLFTVNTAGSVEMKPANMGASCFAAMLYFIGTAQNAAERAKSANLEGPTEELLQTLFIELRDKFMEEEAKQNSAALNNPDAFVNLITTTTDKVVNKAGVGASYLRAGLNVGFEFKPALPNFPFLDYFYSALNRLFVSALIFESEGMKHDGIVQNEQNLIKIAKLKELSNQPLTDMEKDILAYDRGEKSNYAKSRLKSNCALFALTGAVSAITLADLVATAIKGPEILAQKELDPSSPNALPFWATAISGTENWLQPMDLLFGFKLLPTAAATFAMAETHWWSADYNRYDMEHVGYCFSRNFFGIIPALLWEVGSTTLDTAANIIDTLIVTYSQDKGAADSKRNANACRKLQVLKNAIQAQAYMKLTADQTNATVTPTSVASVNELPQTSKNMRKDDLPPHDDPSEQITTHPEQTPVTDAKHITPDSVAQFYSIHTSQLKDKLLETDIMQKAEIAAAQFNPRKALTPKQNYHIDIQETTKLTVEETF